MGVYKYDESYIGKKYNYLTITGFGYNDFGKRCFNCKCDCGVEKLLITTDVITGRVKSCGCMHRELSRKASLVHGAYTYGKPERLYKIYRGMIERCHNKNNTKYSDYGGRGITVCSEWRENYDTFRTWAIKNGYDENKSRKEQSIDRIDNDKGYSPNNCRWTTAAIQRKNQRPHKEHKKNALILFNGKQISKKILCNEYGISVEMFNYRVNRKGMSVLEALTVPKMTVGRPKINL